MIIYHYDDIVPSALVEVYNRNPSDLKSLGFDGFMFSTNPYNPIEIECCKSLVNKGFRVLHVISPGETHLNVIQNMVQDIVSKTGSQHGHGIVINSEDIIFSDPKSALAVAKQISRIFFQKFPEGELGIMHANQYDIVSAKNVGEPQHLTNINANQLNAWTHFLEGILVGLQAFGGSKGKVILFVERTYWADPNQIRFGLDEISFGTKTALQNVEIPGMQDPPQSYWEKFQEKVNLNQTPCFKGLTSAFKDPRAIEMWKTNDKTPFSPGLWPLGKKDKYVGQPGEIWHILSQDFFRNQVNKVYNLGCHYTFIYGQGTAWIKKPSNYVHPGIWKWYDSEGNSELDNNIITNYAGILKNH